MNTATTFKPTSLDSSIAHFFDCDDPRRNWLVAPVSRTRDTGPLQESNFETALKSLGGESDTVEVHRFGHWGPGWFEVILCAPEHETAIEEMESALADYPLLDEDDFSSREYEAYQEAWANYGASEFSNRLERIIGDYRPSLLAALESLPDEALQEFYQDCVPCGDYYYSESDGVALRTDGCSIDEGDLSRLLWTHRVRKAA